MEIKAFINERYGVRVFIVFELVLLVLGIGFLLVGVFMHLKNDVLVKDKAAYVFNRLGLTGSLTVGSIAAHLPILIMCIGSLIIVVSIFGLLSLYCARKRLLTTNGCLLLLLFLAQLITVALIAVVEEKIEDEGVRKQMDESLNKYEGVLSTDSESISWNLIFIRADCCGVDALSTTVNSNEFESSVWWSTRTTSLDLVPQSCCTGATETNYVTYTADIACQRTLLAHQKTGCHQAIKSWITQYISLAKDLGIAVVIFEFLIVPVSFFLCVMKDRRDRTVY